MVNKHTLLLLCVLLVGCGDSKTEFIAKAIEICKTEPTTITFTASDWGNTTSFSCVKKPKDY